MAQLNCRNALITIFDTTAIDGSVFNHIVELLAIYTAGEGDPRITHWRGQIEQCETGRLHLHLYVQANTTLKLGGWQKAVHGGKCDVRAVKKDNGASDYVLKERSRVVLLDDDTRIVQASWGELTKVGKPKGADSEQFSSAVEAIIGADTPDEVAEKHPEQFVKHGAGLKALYHSLWCSIPRMLDEDPTVIVMYGPTGVGKTHHAFLDYIKDDGQLDVKRVFTKTASTGKWWDGYYGQPDVIIEEYRSQLKFGDLLNILDKKPVTFEVKGTTTQLQASKFIITTPVHPAKWYPNLTRDDGAMDQLKRRITQILHFKVKYDAPEDVTDHAWPDPSYDEQPGSSAQHAQYTPQFK